MSRFSLSSLHVRLVVLVILVMIPALGLMIYAGLQQREKSAQQVQDNALQMTQVITAYQEELILRTHQIMREMERVPAVYTYDSEECTTAFQALQEHFPSYTSLMAATAEGAVFCTSSSREPEMRDVSEVDWFQRSVQIRDFTISEVVINEQGTTSQTFGYPVYDDDGALQAVVMAALDMDVLRDFTIRANLPPGSMVTLFDGSGTVLARYPQSDEWVGRDVSETSLFQMLFQRRGDGTAQLAGIDGVPRLYAFTYMRYSEQGLFLSVGIPSEVAFGDVDRTLRQNLLWLGVIALVEVVAAALWGNIFILRPITALVEGTRHLSAGNLDTRIDTNVVVGELHPLALSFNKMAETLQQHEANLRAAEARYRMLVEQLPAVIYTTELNATRITRYISPRIETLLGISANSWMEQTDAWMRHVHPEDRQRVLNMVQHSHETMAPMSIEYRMLDRGGHEVWVRDDGIVVCDAQGGNHLMQGALLDITERKHAEEIIQSQQETLRELSTPLLDIGRSTMLMPLIGALDSQRSQHMMTMLLKGVEEQGARLVILDITGVPVVDTQVANTFIQTATAIRLLGARVIITGVRPEVAQTLVGLGVDLSNIATHSTLQTGVEDALSKRKRQ